MKKMSLKKYITDNKKLLLGALLSIVIIILILTIILYKKSKEETEVESFTNTVTAVLEQAKLLDVKEEYTLVKFPDKKGIISNKGKIKKSNNKKYKEFTDGYIIIYKDNSIGFKLSNGKYCATKTFLDNSVSIELYGPCENYDVEYK